MSNQTQRNRTTACAAAAAVVATAATALPAHAVSWWLPPNYSKHGVSMDHLFNLIFWLTTLVTIGVFIVMAYFMVKYRHDPTKKKAHFSHGHPKLEMVWTIIPAIILMVIALYSKQVWENYRYGEPGEKAKPARILVIGQQFQWNVIYAGPDGKIGRYLVFPKPTDREWPRNADGSPFTFSYGKYQDTRGPADMPYDDAVKAINSYIDQENPLGKVFDDPDGLDDNFDKSPGRPIYLPKGRPVEVQISSKDVIHGFFLPNFRLRLDAVPGLRGVLNFTPTITSKEREDDPANRVVYKNLDALAEAIKQPDHPENKTLAIVLSPESLPRAPDAKSAGLSFDKKADAWKYNDKAGQTIIRDRATITPERLAALREIGVKEITVCQPGYFDLVCGELCGAGHYTMQGQVVVLTPEEFIEQFETKAEADRGHADEKTAVTRR